MHWEMWFHFCWHMPIASRRDEDERTDLMTDETPELMGRWRRAEDQTDGAASQTLEAQAMRAAFFITNCCILFWLWK